MAKQFAVLGSPIDHSKSPAIHNAAYEFLGLDWVYTKYNVDEAAFAAFIAQTDLDGFSLTMPLKDVAFKTFGTSDAFATSAKAANTLVRSGSTWESFNTDVFGITSALNHAPFRKVLVIGSGATARNAVIAVKQLNPNANIEVLARNASKAKELRSLGSELGIPVVLVEEVDDVSGYDLTISTLPPGASLAEKIHGTPNGTLLDVAYNPWPSKLAVAWLAAGGNVVSGIEMLIWQAIAQIRIFSSGNVAKPLSNEEQLATVMRNAAEAEG